MKQRCFWAGSDKLYNDYHDLEWGVPVHDDRTLFEFLILEGAQAGLSWRTILERRENYRQAFDNFNYEKIAKYSEEKILELLENPGIIRNKLKIRSTITNAKAFLKICEDFGSFDKYLWNYVNNIPIQTNRKTGAEIPAQTELSITISKDLKKRGFTFVGPTIIYAFMQAVGIVNDHTIDCFRYSELSI
ncbi:MAG: DNA-3-methyladenine glycosylase I [Candidatus Heimdallarchaeota archaeon]|nr:DNA-3-methyladenine glycosylase I [Candidatus Heimdallarchaeota archaeon]